MAPPTISVVLPMYNAEQYIAEAVASILSQTYQDFELIVVDDGSLDRSASIVRGFNDTRIFIVSMPHSGLVSALNCGISKSLGRYIARMDADDVAHPERFIRQVEYLDRCHNVHLLGTWFTEFSDHTTFPRNPPSSDKLIKRQLFFNNQFGHGTVMIRRSILTQSGLYRPELFPAEDYDLWLRISEVADVANLPMSLYYWRKSNAQISQQMRYLALQRTRAAARLAIQRALGGSDSLGHSIDFTFNPGASALGLIGYAQGALSMGHYYLAKSLLLRAADVIPNGTSPRSLLIKALCTIQSLQAVSRPVRRFGRSLIASPSVASMLSSDPVRSRLPGGILEVLTSRAQSRSGAHHHNGT